MPPSPPWTPEVRQALILDLTAHHARFLGQEPLDSLDGDFYWRGCRLDLREQLQAAWAAEAATAGWPTDGDPLAALRSAWEEARYRDDDAPMDPAIGRIQDEVTGLYPSFTRWQLLEGRPVPLRNAHSGPLGPAGQKPHAFLLGITSGSVTGADLERTIRLMSLAYGGIYGDLGPVPRAARVAVRAIADPAEVSPHPSPPVFPSREPELPAVPVIEVEIGVPFPAPGVVAAAFDAFVQTVGRDGFVLPGRDDRQDPAVALRTWATALLTAHGLSFAVAMVRACNAAGLGPVSQQGFMEQRRRLLRRVPEAVPFLQPAR